MKSLSATAADKKKAVVIEKTAIERKDGVSATIPL